MFYQPGEGHGLPHDPLKAIIAPRPIGWISTCSDDGNFNLAPYSFFNAISTRPPLVYFSSDGAKDSVTNARDTGEFVCNMVSANLFGQMNDSSVDAPRGVSEFEITGLTPAPCELVSSPRVAEAYASLECRVTDIQEPCDLSGQWTRSYLVFGQVVGVHISEQIITDGLVNITKAATISRLGYMDYASIEKTFSAQRPNWNDGKR